MKRCSLAEKANFIVQKRVHVLKAKAFYKFLSDQNEEIIIFSFDCQKNQNLPKVPDQSTYFSRQISLHNFTIVERNSRSALTPKNVFSYVWTEDCYAKDSNLIASAVFDRLNKTNLSSYKTIRLMSDGCGGQNKNQFLFPCV